MLEAMLRCAGYRVGLYTSPHLLRYNERVRIDGATRPTTQLVEAFDAVEDARVAASRRRRSPTSSSARSPRCGCSRARALDALVLEVGLGGRLDAVNIVDADVAVLT